MKLTIIALVLAATATAANAHVEVASGPAHANKSEKVTFAIAHGCTRQRGTARANASAIPAGFFLIEE